MSTKYELLKQLIDRLSEYEKEVLNEAEMTLEGFVDFVQRPKSEDSENMRKMSGPIDYNRQDDKGRKETSVAILVTHIYRYAKLYSKKVLLGTPIQSLDDFSYLVVLLTHESMSKTELIQKNVHEKTTGMEIIKRLIRNGLICQFDDEIDKRSQRIAITEQGKGALFPVLHKLESVTKLMSGNLTELEKNSLTMILRKLDNFHFDIYMNDRGIEIEDIIKDKIKAY